MACVSRSLSLSVRTFGSLLEQSICCLPSIFQASLLVIVDHKILCGNTRRVPLTSPWSISVERVGFDAFFPHVAKLKLFWQNQLICVAVLLICIVKAQPFMYDGFPWKVYAVGRHMLNPDNMDRT
jgi:hypothetical protein